MTDGLLSTAKHGPAPGLQVPFWEVLGTPAWPQHLRTHLASQGCARRWQQDVAFNSWTG